VQNVVTDSSAVQLRTELQELPRQIEEFQGVLKEQEEAQKKYQRLWPG
jgi:hypothetical protein